MTLETSKQARRRRWQRRVIRWSGRGLLAAVLQAAGVFAFFWLTTDLPAPAKLRARAALGNTRILDREGKLLYQLPDPLSGRQQPVALDQIPQALQQATIAIEDTSFLTNPGVDLRGIGRAVWINLRSGATVAGGSTITQQLARNFLLEPGVAQQRTFSRKLREAVLALKLTASYPKAELLALYLNQTYYGGMAYGVEAAAQHFFGKPVRDLDVAECAFLAGLPQAPSHYDPFQGDAALAAARARQATVLQAMVRIGALSAAEAVRAEAEPLQFATVPTTMQAPHFVHYALDLLTAALGPDAVARGGLTITTTLDADLQASAQAILQRQIATLGEQRDGGPDHRVRNGAVVVLDPQSGALLTMVGSPDFNHTAHQGQVNAVLALRQPGSAIKPLTYAAALERGWTPASMILDVPSAFATREGPPYTPENYDRAYHGPLSLREALATSSNVAAVRVLDAIGVPALLEMAERLGIESLTAKRERYGLALTLGGGEVTPLELTTSFAAFANGGHRVRPFAVLAATDAAGTVITLPNQAPTKLADPATAVLDPSIAYLISDVLADRYARMRAFGEQSALDLDRPAAAKTGTTSDWRDNWTVGYTPQRVVGVWVGNADGQPMEAISGITGAGPIWHDVMQAAHRGLAVQPFVRPSTVIEMAVCAEGGMLPSAVCPATRLERFRSGSQPTQPDDSHVEVLIDPLLNCRAPQGYPATRTVSRMYRVLPAMAEAWSVAAGLPRVPRQVCSLEGEAGTTVIASQPSEQPEPGLLVPAPGTVYAISPGIPRERQQIELKAQAGRGAARITIMVDDQPLATLDTPPYRVFWQLRPGVHRATVVAEDEQGREWRSATVEFQVIIDQTGKQ